MHVAESAPTVESNVRRDCIEEGQNVSLICKVTYSGTNLMPLVITWLKYTWISSLSYNLFPHQINSANTANESSVHHSSWTFTASRQTTEIYACSVSFFIANRYRPSWSVETVIESAV